MKQLIGKNVIIKVTTFLAMFLAWIVFVPISNAQTSSEEYLVFEANDKVKTLKVGDILKLGDRLDLAEGAVVRLLDKNGKIVDLEGSFSAIVVPDENETDEANKGNLLQNISTLLFGDKEFDNTLGVSRSLGSSSAKNDQPWVPNVSKHGTYCVLASSPFVTRTNISNDEKLELVSTASGSITKAWPAGQHQLSLADIVKDSTNKYLLKLRQNSSDLHLYDQASDNVTKQISWMAEKGCKTQARLLLHKMAFIAN